MDHLNKKGRIFLVGIGGIGMSGIAEILHNLGYEVTGSDQKEGSNVIRLKKLGIKIKIGHNASNIKGSSFIQKKASGLILSKDSLTLLLSDVNLEFSKSDKSKSSLLSSKSNFLSTDFKFIKISLTHKFSY